MTIKTINKRIDKLEDITKVQCLDGNWNYDSYMHGMANGLILAKSILEDKDPIYLDPPLKWLSQDKKDL